MKNLDRNKQCIYFDRFHTGALILMQLTLQNVVSSATSKPGMHVSNFTLFGFCDISFDIIFREIKYFIHDVLYFLSNKTLMKYVFPDQLVQKHQHLVKDAKEEMEQCIKLQHQHTFEGFLRH